MATTALPVIPEKTKFGAKEARTRSIGGSDNDWIDGGAPDEHEVDTIQGGSGDDVIFGGGGNDIIQGQDGNDEIYGNGGDDLIHGDFSSDELNEFFKYSQNNHDIIHGNEGKDTLYGDYGNDELYIDYVNQWNDPSPLTPLEYANGGDGHDLLVGVVGGSGGNFFGGPGNDEIHAEGGHDHVDTRFGSPQFVPANAIYGGLDSDTIFASEEGDFIDGGAGNDTIFARGGPDEIDGGDDDDSISAGGGDDSVKGGTGNDWLHGGSGEDVLYSNVPGNPDQPYGGLGPNPGWNDMKGTGPLGDGDCDLEDGHADSECPPPTIMATASPDPSDEAQSVTLDGVITDEYFVAGTSQYEVVITWGDAATTTLHSVATLSLNASHVYADDGDYDIDISVTELSDRHGETQLTHHVNNVAPVPTIDSGSPDGAEGTAVILTGSATDPAGIHDTITLAWEANLNGTTVATGTGASFSFTPEDNGEFQITLTASDEDGGSASITHDLTVTNVNPTLGSSISPTTLDEGDAVTVTGTYTDPGAADTHTVTIDWGVTSYGMPDIETFAVSGGSFTRTHVYGDDGPGFNETGSPGNGTPSDSHAIDVSISDDDGGTDSAATQVTVNNVAPAVTLSADSTYGVLLEVGIADPGSDYQTVAIDWGDGQSETWEEIMVGPSFFSHPYDEEGTYTIVVNVQDDDSGAAAPVSITVTQDWSYLALDAPGDAPPGPTGAAISVETVSSVLRQAMRQWRDSAGAATVQNVEIRIEDLPGQRLAAARPGTIVVDADAAGYGWFVDAASTPPAIGDAAAMFGRVDLLSAITHEVGHLLGYRHDDHEHEVMGGRLALGVRTLADQASSQDQRHFSDSAIDHYFAAGSGVIASRHDSVSPTIEDDLRVPSRDQASDRRRTPLGPLASRVVDAKLLDRASPATPESGGGADDELAMVLGGDAELRMSAETGELTGSLK